MSAMKRLFQIMADKKASDIFLSVGAPINIKINGVAMPVNQAIMNADTIRQLLYEVLNERQAKEYEEEMELNTAFALENVGAFRISAFRQKGSPRSDKKASDIFLSVGAPINIKINGVAMPVNQAIMNADTIRQLLYEVLNERQAKEYEEEMELNTAFALENVGAFRISAFRQKGSP